jgi:hypothetical protein
MSFDLKIGNYTIEELVEMFDLPSNYTKQIIENRENKLKEGIIGNKDLNSDAQKNTLHFLSEAKQKLLSLTPEEQQVLRGELKSVLKPMGKGFQQQISDAFNSNYDLKPVDIQTVDAHFVQERPTGSYSSSYPSDFFKGVINPLKKKVLRKQLTIDTRFRDNYYGTLSTNYNMTLPMVFNEVLTMQLSSIELPTTFYNVSKQYGNNFFTIIADDEKKVIIIPSGNYEFDGITKIIQTKIEEALPGLHIKYGINANGNLLTGVNGTGQSLFGLDSSSNVTSLTIDFQADIEGNQDRSTPLPLKLGWLLGFRAGIYENNINYVSEGIVDINGPRYLFLVVDDYKNNVNNNFFSAFNSSLLNKNIIARISTQPSQSSFSILTQNNLNVLTLARDYFGPVNLNNLQIQLLDEYGRVVDLHNMDFSFCLNLVIAYDL